MARDINKFQFKRVNPFQGLIIDADTWRDAHDYHREQQRLHLLAFHNIGIVQGLEVTASNPLDLSVNIRSGLAIDPEGNVIIVPQNQRYQLQTRQKGIIYLIIQFREIPGEPYQPAESGQPTRIVEGYRIQERDKLPDESYLELARIDFDPEQKTIRDAKIPSSPGINEINLNYQQKMASAPAPRAEAPPIVREIVTQPAVSKEVLLVGQAVIDSASKEKHDSGLKNLVRQMNQTCHLGVNFEEDVSLKGNLKQFDLLCITGNSRFDLTEEQISALESFLESGGVIFGEGCYEGQGEIPVKGAREFGLAFNKLASQLKCKLEVVRRGHPLLSAVYLFAEVPQGTEPAMLLEGGRMIYSGSDYGCAWQGGRQAQPLSREVIRSSFEMGINIFAYARMMKAGR